MRTITRDANGELFPRYCNLRRTEVNSDGSMSVSHDYHLSVKEAVEDAVFSNRGVVGLHKVEWCGTAGFQETRDPISGSVASRWLDVTAYYKNLYHERTHDAPA